MACHQEGYGALKEQIYDKSRKRIDAYENGYSLFGRTKAYALQ